MFIEFEKAYYGDQYDGKGRSQNQNKEKKKIFKSQNHQQACLRNPSQVKDISLATIPKGTTARDQSERSIKKAEGQSLVK